MIIVKFCYVPTVCLHFIRYDAKHLTCILSSDHTINFQTGSAFTPAQLDHIEGITGSLHSDQ